MPNNRFSDVSSAAINNGRNARDRLLQQSYDDQQHRFNHQYEVDEDGDIGMRDKLLKIAEDSLQQDQRSKILEDMIPAMMQKITIPHEEEATTNLQNKISSWRHE